MKRIFRVLGRMYKEIAILLVLLSVFIFLVIQRSPKHRLKKIVSTYPSVACEIKSMKQEIEDYMKAQQMVNSSPPIR